MATIPILLDARPRYLGAVGSLLLLPTGAGLLLDEIAQAAAAVTAHAPLVLPLFTHDADYLLALRERGVAPSDIVSAAVFRDPLARFEPSDQFLLVSPACYPADGLDLRRLRDAHADARMLRHLLAFETSTLGTKELVQPGSDGRLRRIQRYFEPVTWPFPAGVIASLVPVACVLTGAEAPWESLADLRRTLAARGVPSQDVPFHDRFFHLDDESGALSLGELRVHELTRAEATRRRGPIEPVVVGDGAIVHPSARLVGPVVIGEGVEICEDALIIGPTLLGGGARIGRGAVVAQCLVPSGVHVDARAELRHGVAGSGPQAGRRGPSQQRHTASAAPPESAAATSSYPAIKGVVEPVLASIVLLALAPLFAIVALLVVATSRGPAFYGDPREGKDGRSFRCWKFRSMRRDANMLQRALMAAQQLDGPQFKMDHDPRVTTVGRWLRRLNVDELPQLWNVARGEMSFVGPRPSPFRENQICVPWRHGRLSVRPGITGLWQVCRRDRASGDFHQWIHYDLLYVRHVSFAVDVRILVATIVTLGGRRPVAIERIVPRARTAAATSARAASPTRVRRPTRRRERVG